ncbi:tRNA (guanosine(37)-N1)-methyltransferase TrmD [Candidatus Pacearchaeota archaeon]|nr:MAG: tRNA (guanosine(37)-N1)-methyltransferase TrmD [Candidatus Pacearchaeota archaeon]
MKIDIITLFPEFFNSNIFLGPLKKAVEMKLMEIKVWNLRDFAKHPKEVDDYPYGGGSGMVLKPEPIFECVDKLKGDKSKIILFSPQGKILNQKLVKKLSKEKHLILICGRYKGVDERVSKIVDLELSIGDYIVSGGEIPALVLIDAIARLLPGTVGDKDSVETDSFEDGLLDAPLYTRPYEYKGLKVPKILLSGNHKKISLWKRIQKIRRTLLKRPDLIDKAKLTKKERKLVETLKRRLKNESTTNKRN